MKRRLLEVVAFTVLLPLSAVLPPPARAAEDAKASQTAKKSVVPVFTLRGVLSETPQGENPFGGGSQTALKDLIARMDKAREDDSVSAVALLVDGAALGTAQVEELRDAMARLKESGKEIHAHADSLSMGHYVLLAGASRISVVPTGDIWITGLSAESPYLRGLLEMMGVVPDYFTCGDYKSAGEMFMRRGPSSEAEENMDWLLDGIFENFVALIGEGRGKPPETVRTWIDQGLFSAEQAQAAGVIDAVEYRHEFVATLQEKYGEKVTFPKRYGRKKSTAIDLSSPFGVLKFYMDLLAGAQKRPSKKAAVAIVYVEGPIVPGKGSPGFPLSTGAIAYSTPIRKALHDAAEDDSVKAVVLRVNSPGGSAVASEIILDATRELKKKKPFIVSMGDVAGSGGYYVACGADTVYADPSTITGSIGVVVGKLATKQMWNKIGVNWKSTRRGQNAGILSSEDVFSDDERARLETWMEEIYGVFKGHVLAARGDRLKKDIDELAGGRVYTGRQALELGLVDKLGGLRDAIHDVADQAGLEDYQVRVIPKPKDFVELLLEDLFEKDNDESTIQAHAGRRVDLGRSFGLAEAALPLLRSLDPVRADVVLKAVRQLDLLQEERILLTMPTIKILH